MTNNNPLDNFVVDRSTIQFIGEDLQRPECILAEPEGSLWVADARGGVVHIRPDKSQAVIGQKADSAFTNTGSERERFTKGTLPNGLAFAMNGDIIVSNFGTDRLELMTRTGETSVLADTLDGEPIGKVNFVLRDSKGRLWVTISTRIKDWTEAVSPNIADGYVALYDKGMLRIVADGFAFTNEVRLDANEEWLYVVETCGCRVTRLRVQPDGSLTDREIFGPKDHGSLIDGIAFDAFGNLWGTHVFTDRIFAITPQGELKILLDDHNPSTGLPMMASFRNGELTFEQMRACGGPLAPGFASVTFGGPDLKTVYIGSLAGTRIPFFRSPVAGLPMIHWKKRRV